MQTMRLASVRRARRLRMTMVLAMLAAAGVAVAVGFAGAGERARAAAVSPQMALGSHVVFAYNDLGMHCINQDFSELMVLPPYNNLRAQVIRRGSEPDIITSGVTVSFSVPSNTHSADKTNFWSFVQPLMGVNLAPNIGLTGHGMSGSFSPTTSGDFEVTGIPITPIDDLGRENPYPLATVNVTSGGQVLARTQTVVPVSWEMNCNICHDTPDPSGSAPSAISSSLRSHSHTGSSTRPVVREETSIRGVLISIRGGLRPPRDRPSAASGGRRTCDPVPRRLGSVQHRRVDEGRRSRGMEASKRAGGPGWPLLVGPESPRDQCERETVTCRLYGLSRTLMDTFASWTIRIASS